MSIRQEKYKPRSLAKDPMAEQVLVVKRNLITTSRLWKGLIEDDLDQYEKKIKTHGEFLPRSIAEYDPTYKQITSYMILKHKDRFFLMTRSTKHTEDRLRNKVAIGCGGHIRQEDFIGDSIFEWSKRELHEEIICPGELTVKHLGIINDDSNGVGKVHIGFAILLESDSPDIRIKSEFKSGQLVTLEECAKQYERLESWSQITVDYLKARTS